MVLGEERDGLCSSKMWVDGVGFVQAKQGWVLGFVLGARTPVDRDRKNEYGL